MITLILNINIHFLSRYSRYIFIQHIHMQSLKICDFHNAPFKVSEMSIVRTPLFCTQLISFKQSGRHVVNFEKIFAHILLFGR